MKEINNEDIKSTITTLVSRVENDTSVIKEYINNRLAELCEISKQKGINDFGWKDSVPDYDCEKYDEDFRDSQYQFFTVDEFAYQTREYLITRFKFDYDRNILIGIEYFDDDNGVLKKDRRIYFPKNSDCNWRESYYLVKMIEQELGIE